MSYLASLASQAFRDPASASDKAYKSPSMRGYVQVAPLDLSGVTPDAASSEAPASPAPGMVWSDTSVAESPVLKVYDGSAWLAVRRALEVSFVENQSWANPDNADGDPTGGDPVRSYAFRGVFAGTSDYTGSYFWKAPSAPLRLDAQLFDLLCRADDWAEVPLTSVAAGYATGYRW